VQILQPNQLKVYESFISSAENSMLYHQLNYIQFAAELLTAEVEVFGIFEGTNLVAACPWIVKDGEYGKVYNSLAYYGSNGGVICTNPSIKNQFENEMMEQIEGRACSIAYISSTFAENRLQTRPDYFLQERLAQVSSFPKITTTAEEDLMQVCHPKNRGKIRKGLKENISVKTVSESSFLQNIHQQNMKAIGVEPKSAEFFEDLPHFFNPGVDYKIYELTIDESLACAILVFYHKETMVYFTPALAHEFRNKQPLSALIYTIMVEGMKQGYKYWDWGGTPKSNEDLYKFKKRWGTEDRRYFYQSKIINSLILDASSKQLQSAYPGMFVAPYDALMP